jgi:hypothetical protein
MRDGSAGCVGRGRSVGIGGAVRDVGWLERLGEDGGGAFSLAGRAISAGRRVVYCYTCA